MKQRPNYQQITNVKCLELHIRISEITKGKAYALFTKQEQSVCCKGLTQHHYQVQAN